MKINTKRVKKVNKLGGIKSKAVTIGNHKKVIEVATKGLYAQPLRTAVQEHISNAKDSHDAAGVSLSKIEITCPTLSSLELVIKDTGLGMSEKEVFENYAQLGVSTKDKSNEFLGAFGYGALSWFAVSPSFSLTTIKDGKKCVFFIARDDEEFAKVDLLSKTKTKEANGVELKLPINDSTEAKKVEQAINRAIRFWKVKPTLKNMKGEKLIPEFFGDNGIIYNHKENKTLKEYPAFVISFGGIEYFLDLDTITELKNENTLYCRWGRGTTVVLNVALGEIEVPSDRERILVNDKSLKLLKSRLNKLKEETMLKIKKDIKDDWSRVSFWGPLNDLYLTEDFTVHNKDGIKVDASIGRNSSLNFSINKKSLHIQSFYKNERGHLERSSDDLEKCFNDSENLLYYINDEGISDSSYKKRLKTLNLSHYRVIDAQRPFTPTQKTFLESQGFSFKLISSIKEPKLSNKTQGRSQVTTRCSSGLNSSSVIYLKDLSSGINIIPDSLFVKYPAACRYIIKKGGFSKIASIKDKDLFLFEGSNIIKENRILSFFQNKKLKDAYDYHSAIHSLSEKDQEIVRSFKIDEIFEKQNSSILLSNYEMLKSIPFIKVNKENKEKILKNLKKEISKKEKIINTKLLNSLVYSELNDKSDVIPFRNWRYSSITKKTLSGLKKTKLTKTYDEVLTIAESSNKYSWFNKHASATLKKKAQSIVKNLENTISKIKKERESTYDFVLDLIEESVNQNETVQKNRIKEINDLLNLIDKS